MTVSWLAHDTVTTRVGSAGTVVSPKAWVIVTGKVSVAAVAEALASGVAVTGARTAAGADDADAITEATGVPVGRRLHDGDLLVVGHVTLEVVALRGHTPGSVALAYREPEHTHVPGAAPGRVHLLTGDSLFPGGVGRTTTPQDFTSLYDDVVARVFDRFDDETWVYPGHGRDTTLGAERPHLAQWRARGW